MRLLARMGRASGADIAAGRASGRLASQDWAAMVTRCRACPLAEGCADWLDSTNTSRPGILAGCRNADALGALAGGAA